MDLKAEDFQGCSHYPSGAHKFYFQNKGGNYEPILPTDAMYQDELVYKFQEYAVYSCNCTKTYKVRVNSQGL